MSQLIEEIRIHRTARGTPTRIALYNWNGEHVGDMPCTAFSVEGAVDGYSKAMLEVHGFRVKIVDECPHYQSDLA
jgi:hypothetical protein